VWSCIAILQPALILTGCVWAKSDPEVGLLSTFQERACACRIQNRQENRPSWARQPSNYLAGCPAHDGNPWVIPGTLTASRSATSAFGNASAPSRGQGMSLGNPRTLVTLLHRLPWHQAKGVPMIVGKLLGYAGARPAAPICADLAADPSGVR